MTQGFDMPPTATRPTLVLLCLLLLSTASPATGAKTAIDWRAEAIRDIEAAYQRTRENHAGIHDPFNPKFSEQLDRARTRALEFADRTHDAAGYEASIIAFSAVINDGHAGAFPELPPGHKRAAMWPGFLTAWRGDGLYVYKSLAGGPAAGARVVSCDGVEITALIRRNVFAFAGREEQKGRWWVQARNVLVDFGNPFLQRPKSCSLAANASPFSVPLTWIAVDENYQRWRAESNNGDRLPIGLSEPRPGIFWIAMPTFTPDQAGRDAYDVLYGQLERQREKILKAKAVVLDLRHNLGGSSIWSRRVAEGLWGKEVCDIAMESYFAGTEIWWRPSAGNIAHVGQMASQAREQNRPESAKYYEPIIAELTAAHDGKREFFIQKLQAERSRTPSATGARSLQSDFAVPVYLITPGQCASACLDATDVFSRFANTTRIGAPTSADSTYMEVRTESLPSGMAKVILPIKFWVNRPRSGSDIYEAKVVVNSLDWSTGSFLKVVEQQLGKRLD